MDKDIEMLDPALRDVVARLKAAPTAHVRESFHADVMAALEGRPARQSTGAYAPSWFYRNVASRHAAFAIAATIVALLGVATLFMFPAANPPVPSDIADSDAPAIELADGSRPATSIAPYAPSYAVQSLVADQSTSSETLARTVEEIAKTQNADGGWGCPELTLRNTAALAMAVRVGDKTAKSAWKRGVRHLRAHGIPEIDSF